MHAKITLLIVMGIGLLLLACALPVLTNTPANTRESPEETVRVTINPVTPEQTPSPSVQPPDGAMLPDLVAGYYRVEYDDCPWGGPGTITIHIDNQGNAGASPFNVLIEDTETVLISGLAAGEQTDAGIKFDSGPVGYVAFAVDPENQVAESDETNNDYKIIFTPPPPCTTATP